MRERGIILQPWEVRAFLDNRKQRLTRVVKPQPEFAADGVCWYPSASHKKSLAYANEGHLRRGLPLDFSPLGQPGDRLYGKETWAVGSIYDGVAPRDICADLDLPPDVPRCGVRYAATDSRNGIKDRSPVTMPRWASRILLEVTEVRVQRLDDITTQEALAEGAFFTDYGPHKAGWSVRATTHQDQCLGSARMAVANAWVAKHGPYSWEANPWVFAATVKRLEVDRG